jgi:hypothetical protein
VTRSCLAGFVLIASCTCSTVAFAQGGAAESAPKPRSIDDLYVDFSVPDLPALASLGLNPSKISRPGNLKELSVSVFPIAGSTAAIGPGVAVAWAPVYTFASSIDDYRKSLLRRLAFSLVTAKEGTTSAINAGGGVRVMLVDRSDPVISEQYQADVFKLLEADDISTRRSRLFMQNEAEPTVQKVADLMSNDPLVNAKIVTGLIDVWDLRKPPTPFAASAKRTEFDKAIAAAAQANSVPLPTIGPALNKEIDELIGSFLSEVVTAASALKAKLAKLDEKFREAHWNAAAASVDAGIVSQSSDGSWRGLQGRKTGASLSAAFPAGAHGQLIAQLQGRKGLGTDPSERSYVGGGARWIVGTSTKRFSGEAFVANADDKTEAQNGKSSRFTVGGEFRVAKGFWFELAFGSEHTPASDGQHLLSLANLKYAFKNEPRFKDIPGSVEEEK